MHELVAASLQGACHECAVSLEDPSPSPLSPRQSPHALSWSLTVCPQVARGHPKGVSVKLTLQTAGGVPHELGSRAEAALRMFPGLLPPSSSLHPKAGAHGIFTCVQMSGRGQERKQQPFI